MRSLSPMGCHRPDILCLDSSVLPECVRQLLLVKLPVTCLPITIPAASSGVSAGQLSLHSRKQTDASLNLSACKPSWSSTRVPWRYPMAPAQHGSSR